MNKNMIAAVLLIIMFLISGCSAVKNDGETEPVYGNAKAIKIEETGGEDGRNLVWQMYEQDGEYYISADNLKFDRHILQEITEEEYSSVMDINYNEYFEKYLRDKDNVVMDDVYHHTTIEFADQLTYEGDDYNMTQIIQQMTDVADNYDTCDFKDFYY